MIILSITDKTDVPKGETREICALIGIIYLLAGKEATQLYAQRPLLYDIPSGPYLIVATRKERVGQIDGHLIFEITGFDVVPCVKSTIHLASVQVCLRRWWHSTCYT